MQWFGRGLIGLVAASVVGIMACSTSDSDGGTAAGGTAGSDAGSSGSSGTAGSAPACARETTASKLVPLDIFVMLDASESMGVSAGTASTKWAEVANGLLAFLNDSSSAGIGVGLGYFPLELEGIPDSCPNDAACGEGGPCVSKICLNLLLDMDVLHTCDTDNDCDIGTASPPLCRTIGDCSSAPGNVCFTESVDSCSGTCTQAGICTRYVDCDVSRYSTPAVPIAELPAGVSALRSSLQKRMPTEKIATVPALSGALQQARAWAEDHPDHDVVTLLVMGGIPSECSGEDISTGGQAIARLAAIAESGAKGGVRTFVIGVFAADEIMAGARTHMNSIAQAGGTEWGFTIDSAGNIMSDFSAALSQIRTKGSCEIEAPEADYDNVNLDFTSGAVSTRIPRVQNQAACDLLRGGWYYDVDPSAGAPKRIVTCPTSCAALKAAGGSVRIELGCESER